MILADEIRNEIENIKELKITVGDINNHLSVLEGITRKDIEEREKEAYQRGYDDATKMIASDEQSIADKDYQSGLDDAMNAFKKLYSCGWERDFKAMGFEFNEGEWSRSFEYIIDNYTASEIVEKVRAYEKSQRHFGVGDFVSNDCLPEITVLVTYVRRDTFNGIAVTDVEGHCHIGEAYSCCAFENWHKVNAQLVKGES